MRRAAEEGGGAEAGGEARVKLGMPLATLALIGCTTIAPDGVGFAGSPASMERFTPAARQCGLHTSRPVPFPTLTNPNVVAIFVGEDAQSGRRGRQLQCVRRWVEDSGGGIEELIRI